MNSNIVKNIKQNHLFIAFTDTTLGIGGVVNNDVLKKINKVKKSEVNKRLIIMIDSIKMAQTFNGWTEKEEKLAREYWPGALTIILDDQTALRVPNQKELLALISQVGPIYMTSCNLHNEPFITNLEEAKNKFKKNIKIFINNYYKNSNMPSTIVYPKMNNKIIRQGEIKIK